MVKVRQLESEGKKCTLIIGTFGWDYIFEMQFLKKK